MQQARWRGGEETSLREIARRFAAAWLPRQLGGRPDLQAEVEEGGWRHRSQGRHRSSQRRRPTRSMSARRRPPLRGAAPPRPASEAKKKGRPERISRGKNLRSGDGIRGKRSYAGVGARARTCLIIAANSCRIASRSTDWLVASSALTCCAALVEAAAATPAAMSAMDGTSAAGAATGAAGTATGATGGASRPGGGRTGESRTGVEAAGAPVSSVGPTVVSDRGGAGGGVGGGLGKEPESFRAAIGMACAGAKEAAGAGAAIESAARAAGSGGTGAAAASPSPIWSANCTSRPGAGGGGPPLLKSADEEIGEKERTRALALNWPLIGQNGGRLRTGACGRRDNEQQARFPLERSQERTPGRRARQVGYSECVDTLRRLSSRNIDAPQANLVAAFASGEQRGAVSSSGALTESHRRHPTPPATRVRRERRRHEADARTGNVRADAH
eukprot:scaffold303908_cov28-Tisochrysis_lutea.AAC.5